jgi:cytochrome bd-type quinol oxidase subunit 1
MKQELLSRGSHHADGIYKMKQQKMATPIVSSAWMIMMMVVMLMLMLMTMTMAMAKRLTCFQMP